MAPPGGSDVTRALARLLLGHRRAASLGPRGQERMRRLKESLAHLDLDTCALETCDFDIGEISLMRFSLYIRLEK